MVTVLSRRVRAWVALTAFLAALALPWGGARHVWNDDDAACEPSVFASEPLQFSSPSDAALPQHCPYCHWQRAVSNATLGSIQAIVPWLDVVGEQPLDATSRTASAAVPHGPSRAPPAALVS